MSDIKAVVTMDYGAAVVRQDRSPSVPSIGIQGLGTPQSNIEDLKNVDAANAVNGSVLVYKVTTNKWTSTTTLDAQNMEGGEF